MSGLTVTVSGGTGPDRHEVRTHVDVAAVVIDQRGGLTSVRLCRVGQEDESLLDGETVVVTP